MGNCQVIEAATVVIQHPGGRVDRLYRPTSAAEVMQNNPGHYVALITFCLEERSEKTASTPSVRLTRVRLLKPKDTLFLGQVYRLITSQEVAKALKARKSEKIKKAQRELIKKQQQLLNQQSGGEDHQGTSTAHVDDGTKQTESEEIYQQVVVQKSAQSAVKSRQWRPSLQSISEIGSRSD